MTLRLLNTWHNLHKDIQDVLTAIGYSENTKLPITETEKSFYIGDKDCRYSTQDLKILLTQSNFAGITGDGRMRFAK